MPYFKKMLKSDLDTVVFNTDEKSEEIYYSGLGRNIKVIFRASIYPETGEDADYLIVKIEDVKHTLKNSTYFTINGIDRYPATSSFEELDSIIAKVRLQKVK
jgi:hypothetical protein